MSSTSARPVAAQARRRSPWTAVGSVLAAALLAGALAVALAWPWTSAEWTATGTVRLTEITGNRADYEYNAFAAQLQSALDGTDAARAVDTVLPDGAVVTDITMSRRAEASRVTLRATATDERTARFALLAAGRAAYQELVDAEREQHALDEALAEERLTAAAADLQQLRAAVEAGGGEPEQSPLYRQLDQAVGRAVAELSGARTGLAVADTVEAGLERSNAVTVDQVASRSAVSELLRVGMGGALAGALLGAASVHVRTPRSTGMP